MSLALTVTIALVAAAGIQSFQRRAQAAHTSVQDLALLRGDLYRALFITQEALRAGDFGADDERLVRLAIGQGQARLDDLNARDAVAQSNLVVLFVRVRVALEGEIPYLRARDEPGAAQFEREQVDPSFGALVAVIADLTQVHQAVAQRADRAADVGTRGSLLAAALAISALGSLTRRARRRGAVAAAESAAREQGRFRSLVQSSSDVITVVTPAMNASYVSPSVERLLGHAPDEAAASWSALVHPDDIEGARTVLAELASEGPGTTAAMTFRVMNTDGSWHDFEAVATNMIEDENVGGLVLNMRDITERTMLEGQLTHRAFHDTLTDLPNRALFRDRLGHALDRAARGGDHTTVALLDLDNFKSVNDSLGHGAGDDLLEVVASRLSACMRPGDTVARLGGDEFAVLLEATYEVEALAVADRILATLREPVDIGGRPIIVQASIGLASSRDAADPGALMRNADLAMYAAKGLGRGRVEAFHKGMHEVVQARMELESDLRHALQDAVAGGQLRLLYQPKVSLVTRQITGVEALVRWEHPKRGTVAPMEFIPLAEDTGLIVEIGAWVLETACRQAFEWRNALPGGQAMTISVNVSGRQFTADLVSTVTAALDVSGLEPSSLCLEVTESVVMKDVEFAVSTLKELKTLGIHISIDDFGTGYSSLSYLRQFPLDELKVDKTFVDGLGRSSGDSAIVGAVMGMAQALHLTVVAEGVETAGQAGLLQEMGCETAQGYFFARPITAEAIWGMLSDELEVAGPTKAT